MQEKTVLKIIRGSLYAMIIAVPLFFWKWTMNPFIVVKTAIFQSLAGVIILLWLALLLHRRKHTDNRSVKSVFSSVKFVRFTPLSIGVLVFLSALTLSAFLGQDLLSSLWSHEVRTLGVISLWFFALLFLALSSLEDAIDWEKVWTVSLWTSLFAALGALLAFIPAINSLFLNQGSGRPGSSFGNPTFLAGYLLFHVFIGLYLWVHTDRTDKNTNQTNNGFVKSVFPFVSSVGISIIDALAIFQTQTRGDLGGLVIGLLLIVLLLAIKHWRKSKDRHPDLLSSHPESTSLSRHPERSEGSYRNPWLCILIAVIAFSGTFYLTRSSSFWTRIPGFDRIQSFTTVRSEFENRVLAWQSAAESFASHPVFGFGWENFNLAFQAHYNPVLLTNTFDETYWDKPHNVLIEYGVTGGVVGLLAYLGMWVFLLYELFSLSRHPESAVGGEGSSPLRDSSPPRAGQDDLFTVIFFGMLAAYFIRNLVIFDTIGTYLMFFLVMAYINSRYQRAYTDYTDKNTNHTDTDNGSVKSVFPSVRSVSLAYPLLVLSLVPIIFLNWQMVYGAGREYWIPNYYLNNMIPESLTAGQEALATLSPYRDDIRLTYEGVINQAYQSGIAYPDIQNLQKKVVDETQAVVNDHPKNYLFYDVLAELKNTFYTFDSNYLKEAETLEAQALALSPNRQQTYYVIGKTKALEGDTQGAYDAFKTAVDLNPQAGDPHFYLGLLAYELKDTKTGDEEIAKAKALGRVPRSADEATALGNLVGDEEQNYDAAIGYYKQALVMSKSTNQYDETQLKIAVAYYLSGKDPEAKAAFQALEGEIDFRSLPLWSQLEPVFQQLGIILPPSPTSTTPEVQVIPR